MREKNFFRALATMTVVSVILPSMVCLAQFGPPDNIPTGPDSGLSGPPTAEQIQQMQQQAQAQAQAQMQSQNQLPPSGTEQAPNTNGQFPQGMPSGMPAGIPAEMPAGMPTKVGGFDLSKMSMPTAEGGMPPTFAGVSLSGGANPMVAKLGEVLDQINDKLTTAEDDTKDLVDGQVPGAPKMVNTLKQSRDVYNQARAAFISGDYAQTGTLLNKMPKPPTPEELDKLGITHDLINDVRAKLNAAAAEIDKNIDDPAEATNAKVEITAALTQLDSATAKLKAGDKKGAAVIMNEMRKNAPSEDVQGAAGNFNKIPASKIKEVIDMSSERIATGEANMQKAESSGINIDQEAKDLMAKGKALLSDAKTAFDKGDIKTAASKMKEMKDLNMEDYFSAFKEKIMPVSRMQEILKQGQDGVKALKLTIDHAKTYGMDTSELDSILSELEPLIAKAAEALAKNDRDMFLQYMTMADQLHVNDRVDKIIKNIANVDAKSLVEDGIAAISSGLDDLNSAIQAMDAKKINTANAKALMAHAQSALKDAQAKFDAGEYMEAGKILDTISADFSSFSNIAKDMAFKLTPEQAKAIGEAVAAGRENQLTVSVSQKSKAQELINAANAGDAMDINNTLNKMDPQLLDKVIASREKNKGFIDSIIKDVMPLIPEDQRAATMEGKLGLMEESKAADKTIAGIKQIKGVKADTIKLFDETRKSAGDYTFSPDVAESIDAKLSDFNDRVQSGDIKDSAEVTAYAKVLNDEVKKAIASDNADKYKKKVIPAKNIDTNNLMFDEVKNLTDDGALKPDKNGNINLDQQVNGKALADMINKTMDKTAAKVPSAGNITVKDAALSIANSYGIKIPVNTSDAKSMANYLKSIGADISSDRMAKKATVKDVADILSSADQRWGIEGNQK